MVWKLASGGHDGHVSPFLDASSDTLSNAHLRRGYGFWKRENRLGTRWGATQNGKRRCLENAFTCELPSSYLLVKHRLSWTKVALLPPASHHPLKMAPSAHGPSYLDAQSSLWTDTPPEWMSLNGVGLTCFIERAAIGRPEYGIKDHYTRSKAAHIGLPLSHLALALSYVRVRTTMQGKNPLPMKTVSLPLLPRQANKSTNPTLPIQHKNLYRRSTTLRTSSTELLASEAQTTTSSFWSPLFHQTHRLTNRPPAPNLPRHFSPGQSMGSVSCLG